MAAKKSISEMVRELAEPTANELGLRVWEVKFVKEGADWFLRIDIDKDGGVGIEDCEKMSRAIDPLLDEHDFIDKAYCLEVSSPGINRELSRPEHFQILNGEDIIIRLIRPQDGTREFSGKLKAFDGANVTLEALDGEKVFTLKDIAHIKLDDFKF